MPFLNKKTKILILIFTLPLLLLAFIFVVMLPFSFWGDIVSLWQALLFLMLLDLLVLFVLVGAVNFKIIAKVYWIIPLGFLVAIFFLKQHMEIRPDILETKKVEREISRGIYYSESARNLVIGNPLFAVSSNEEDIKISFPITVHNGALLQSDLERVANYFSSYIAGDDYQSNYLLPECNITLHLDNKWEVRDLEGKEVEEPENKWTFGKQQEKDTSTFSIWVFTHLVDFSSDDSHCNSVDKLEEIKGQKINFFYHNNPIGSHIISSD